MRLLHSLSSHIFEPIMNSFTVKIFSILLFLVIGMHFFHSEFDLFSCEANTDHHASYDYCQLVNNVIITKASIPAIHNVITDILPQPIFIQYDNGTKIIHQKIRDVFLSTDCPDYIFNRIILI